MSTALKKYEPQEFAALDPQSPAKRAFEANIGEEGFSMSDLIRVKMPSGGGLIWTIDGSSGPEATQSIDGVLVFQARNGVLWPSQEPADDSKPVVDTIDMKVGRIRGEIKRDESGVIIGISTATDLEMVKTIAQHEIKDASGKGTGTVDWNALPYTQFGTGKGGHGKFAKEGRVLFILRKGSVLPLMLRTGPSAVGIVKKFLTQMELPYWHCVVSLTLKEEKSNGGQKYSAPVPRVIGQLPPEAIETIEKSYKGPLEMAWNAGRIVDAGEEAAEA